jgi:eukaryotic-like serine/threonine-protein kinase
VLYEMLAGRRAFPGATTSDTIAKILEREPDWNPLPSSTPSSVRRLLARCFEKEPKQRLHALADAHFDLDEALVESTSRTETRAARAPEGIGHWPIVAAVAAVLLAVAVWWLFSPQVADLPSARVVSLRSYPGTEASPSFSPDGKQVAFSWDGGSGANEDIYVVIVGSDTPVPLTKDPARDLSPAWKPDGSQIAFARVDGSRVSVYTVSSLGQSEQKLAEFSPIQCTDCPPDPTTPAGVVSRWAMGRRQPRGIGNRVRGLHHCPGRRHPTVAAAIDRSRRPACGRVLA